MLFCLGLVTVGRTLAADTVSLPLLIDHAIVRSALAEQIFVGADESMRVLSDASGCNAIVVASPQVSGHEDGSLRVRARITTRGGTPLGGRCALPFEWDGLLELAQTAFVTEDGDGIGFRITDSQLLVADGARRSVPGVLWGLVSRYVHPRMTAFTLDLAPLLEGTRHLLDAAWPHGDDEPLTAATTVRLQDVATDVQALRATLSFDLPPLPPQSTDEPDEPGEPDQSAAPLSTAELAAWDANWQAWDAFATWFLRDSAQLASPDLRHALLEALLLARHELRAALGEDARDDDPVRQLFVTTWERVVPLLGGLSPALPGTDALRYVAFLNAGGALAALDAAAPHVGLRFDAGTFRRLARTLAPGVPDEDLQYSTDVDPALRTVFGFEVSPLDAPVPPLTWLRVLDWLIAPARALAMPEDVLARLNAWIPGRREIDAYIRAVDTLLQATVERERARGKIAPDYFDVYRVLLPATAWQETCWRQFVQLDGVVSTIRSTAGSVGLMQVNSHVWRGLYDLARLESEIGYNVTAGNEILVHYLVDYAIRKKEHEATDDVHNLARSTYAMYNGGPGHLSRYRNPETKRSLRAIDNAFWKKYEAIRERGADAVKQCYGS